MKFCTQCGNKTEEKAKFCGKCGMKIEREEASQSTGLESGDVGTTDPGNHAVSQQRPATKKITKKTKIIGLIAVISVVILYFLIAPKQLTEQEYEDVAIQLIAEDEIAMQDFGEVLEYTDIYMGYEPEWTEEFTQLVEPAKELENRMVKIRKTLEDVKPPKYFEYEQEHLLKYFTAHENAAVHIRTFMEEGGLQHIDLVEEYQDRGDDLIEESIFVSDEYEDRLMEVYERMMME